MTIAHDEPRSTEISRLVLFPQCLCFQRASSQSNRKSQTANSHLSTMPHSKVIIQVKQPTVMLIWLNGDLNDWGTLRPTIVAFHIYQETIDQDDQGDYCSWGASIHGNQPTCFVSAVSMPHSKVIIQVKQPTVIFLLLLFPKLSIIVVMFLAKEHQLNTTNFAILFALEIRSLFKRMRRLQA